MQSFMNRTSRKLFRGALVALLLSIQTVWAYYDPGVQRWINRDPAGVRGGINGHAFLGNNPQNRSDAFGLTFLPPLPGWPWWFPSDPVFPWPLANWPGGTWCQRLDQCKKDCDAAYQQRIDKCMTFLEPCPFHNRILCAIDKISSPIVFGICMGDNGLIREVCKANCNARAASPWNW